MHMPLFRGSAVALVTPFSQGRVDIEALRRLVQAQVEGGTAAIIACGTTGEPSTMTPDEREKVVEETLRAAQGRVPVICGTGSNDTHSVIQTANRYRGLGCAAQLVVTPYYNKTTQEGLYAHFMAIAEQTELPIIIYNVPGRTAMDISPQVLSRLAATGRFAGLKESAYDVPGIMEKLSAIDGRFPLYSGNDDMVYPLLALGAQGVISVVANVLPKAMSAMTERYFAGDTAGALEDQLRLLPLVRALFCEVNPIPVKYAMGLLGLCSDELRLPLVRASEAAQGRVRGALEALGAL